MKDKHMSIELFHQMINAERDGDNRLLEALRSLRSVNGTNNVAQDPQPLGAWPGWSI